MTNKPFSAILCTLLIALLLLSAITSWVMAAMGVEVQNLLCAEGYRWICLHALELLTPKHLGSFIACFIILGYVESTGVINVIRRKHRTVNEKLGLTVSFILFFILLSPVIVPVLKVNSALRSVTGQLYPSPWATGLPFTLSLILFFTSLCFCLFVHKENFFTMVGRLLSTGISRYALWLIDLSLLNLLVETVKYILS